MNTFLPYPDFAKSAAALDRQRLGKQRIECVWILKALLHKTGNNHPAVRMWAGYESALAKFCLACITEWKNRGYKSHETEYALYELIGWHKLDLESPKMPPWFGEPCWHEQYKRNLQAKGIEMGVPADAERMYPR